MDRVSWASAARRACRWARVEDERVGEVQITDDEGAALGCTPLEHGDIGCARHLLQDDRRYVVACIGQSSMH